MKNRFYDIYGHVQQIIDRANLRPSKRATTRKGLQVIVKQDQHVLFVGYVSRTALYTLDNALSVALEGMYCDSDDPSVRLYVIDSGDLYTFARYN